MSVWRLKAVGPACSDVAEATRAVRATAKSTRRTAPTAGCRIEPLEARAMFAATPTPDPTAGGDPVVGIDVPVTQPTVLTVNPAAGATGVKLEGFVSADLTGLNGGVDVSTLTADAAFIRRKSDGAVVPATVNTSGGGDVIVVKPTDSLAPLTEYEFVVTAGVRDVTGAAFAPFASSFTTAAPEAPPPPTKAKIQFEKAAQQSSAGHNYFGLTVGPDGRMYAAGDDGYVYRFDVAADGTLGTPAKIDAIRKNNGGARFVTGLAFAPGSTADDLVLWVTHSDTSALDVGGRAGDNFSGKVSVLSGPDLGTYRDAVVNLPRSVRDHVTDQLTFGPDGAVYFCQPSQSAMGAPDLIWGNRPETLLSATILRLDVAGLGTGTIDARTKDVGGPYDPFAAGAKLTIYATGVRNAYNLVWHRNGHLYAPANGSAAGGNTPAGPAGSNVPGLTAVGKPEADYLFDIKKGRYYGHPNAKHGKYVLNGGNPTAGADPYEVSQYPVGTKPESNWTKAVFNFGAHESPDGALEYRGPAFGGALNGKLLVVRYSGGDDVIALTLNADGSVAKAQTGLPGMSGFSDPVDIAQDPRTGNLYVSELGRKRITLLRVSQPATPTPTPTPEPTPVPPPPPPPPVVTPPVVTPPVVTPPPVTPPVTVPPVTVPPTQVPASVPPVSVPEIPPPSRSELKTLAKAQRTCTKYGFVAPAALESLRGRELKSACGVLKSLVKTAVKRKVFLPDLTARSVADLTDLIVQAKAATKWAVLT